jgi:serine/threonine protein kinase
VEYRKLGHFRLAERLAQGGMGEVIRSLDDRGRPVALKTILQEHEDNQVFRDLFMREAEITFQLNHPNIVKAYQFEEIGNKLVLVLEYLDGVNLREVLKLLHRQGTRMPVALALNIMSAVLKGLGYAHKKRDKRGKPLGIIHRDLNPANIFMTYSGEVKILDFGISKAVHEEVHQLTPNGELRGKMCYLSPEQIRGDNLDHRSDIFAMGIVLWEMLAGEPLYLRDLDQDAMAAICRGEHHSLRKIRNDVPSAIEAVIRKMLHPQRDYRFQDSEAVLKSLQEASRTVFTSGVDETELSFYLKSLFRKDLNVQDSEFLAGCAWIQALTPGLEKKGLEALRGLHERFPDRPSIQLYRAKAELVAGDRAIGLRLMRKLARTDSMEQKAQTILEWLGVRRKPVLRFLNRSNPINNVLGRVRHKMLGPTPYQAEFISA